jgi:hypothetical protein
MGFGHDEREWGSLAQQLYWLTAAAEASKM